MLDITKSRELVHTSIQFGILVPGYRFYLRRVIEFIDYIGPHYCEKYVYKYFPSFYEIKTMRDDAAKARAAKEKLSKKSDPRN